MSRKAQLLLLLKIIMVITVEMSRVGSDYGESQDCGKNALFY